jgi:hypothetical protein
MIPNAILVRTRLLRGATIWVATRAAVGLLLLMGSGDPIRLHGAASLALVGTCVAAATIDEFRMGEGVLIANLGVSRAWCLLLDLVPPLLGELAVRLAVARFT